MKQKNLFIFVLAASMATASWCGCTKDRSLEDRISIQTDPINVIGISSSGYNKTDHWVGKDQPVTWVNNDNTVHSVTDDNGNFDSGAIQPGRSYTREFDRPGVYTYHDNYSSARATITIIGRE